MIVTGILKDDLSRGDLVFFNQPGVAVVTWDPTFKAVHVEWLGWADSTEFAAVLEAGLRALTEHDGSRWLADCRNQRAIQQPVQEWIDRDWFPRALTGGLKRMAVVMAKRVLARMNLEDVLARVSGKLDVGTFETVSEATEWLTRPTPLHGAAAQGDSGGAGEPTC